MAVGICCADHATPHYPQKLALTSPTSGGRSVSIVCSRTKATELLLLLVLLLMHPNYYEVAHDYTSFAFFFFSSDIVTVSTL
jgi:hypothetical protein